MPPDPLPENESIADLMGPDPSSRSSETAPGPEIDALNEAELRQGIADLIVFVGAMIEAEKRQPATFLAVRRAGVGMAAFDFELANRSRHTVTLDLPGDVLGELQPAAEAILEFLQGCAQ